MRFWTKRFRTIRSIEWVLVAASLINGAYVFSPLYRNSVATHGATPFVSALAHPALVYVYAGAMVIAALAIAWGLYKNKANWRSCGLFAQMLLRFYNVLTTILVVGVFPITWIYAATIVFICLMLWIGERIEVKFNATP